MPDPDTRAHLEWLGFIQPNGLMVSAPALVKAGAVLNRQDAEGQSRLAACVREREFDPARGPEPCLPDFREFAGAVLGWGFSPRGYAGTEEAPIPAELEVPLPDYGETLRPHFAVRERDPRDGQPPWQLLVQVLDPGQDFDAPATGGGAGPRLEASPHGRIERLLRGAGVSGGLLFNGVALRLVSAPRGESSGWMDFRVADMSRSAGRPLCSALRLLLSEQRLLALPRAQRLAALLEDSRRYQNEVSERLSEQVMHALYELLRGLQTAHDASRGELLREPLSSDGDRDDVYRGLLSVILRLVFLLYAEERGVLPEDETFAATTRSPASTGACAKTPRSTPTPWTSASAPGRSFSCCFASSTTEHAPGVPAARSACRSAAVRCSIRTTSPSSKAAMPARAPDRRSSGCGRSRLLGAPSEIKRLSGV